MALRFNYANCAIWVLFMDFGVADIVVSVIFISITRLCELHHSPQFEADSPGNIFKLMRPPFRGGPDD